MQKPNNTISCSHTFSCLARGRTVYDLSIIVFSNLQKHSMNFKFSYKWFLFMPNEQFAREPSRVEAREEISKEWRCKAEGGTNFLINEFR